jgi:hypothetical protein
MRRILSAWALVTVLAACGGGDTPPPPPPSVGSATIDSAGGEVLGPDGVRLVVPAGALSAATTLRIARDGTGAPELGGAKAISPVYAVTPHGTAFAESARISIPFRAVDVAPGTQPVLLRAQPSGGWEALVTDVQGGTVSAADTPGLSYYTVGTCFTSRDTGVAGPEPLLYCPSAHTLELRVYDGNGALLPVPRNGSGVAQPIMTISAPTSLRYSLLWTRPAGTQRSDRVWMQIVDAGLQPAQQPLIDFAVNRDFTQTFTTTIDPATVPGASVAGGKVIRLRASVVYTTDAYYPGCVCFRPASWNFTTEIPVRVVYTGTAPVITQHPADASATEGQSFTFTVSATGPNLSAQWLRDRASNAGNPAVNEGPVVAMPNGTATLTKPATADLNGWGFFAEVCSNRDVSMLKRCVTSNAGVLSVVPVVVPPTFTVQPASVTVIAGQTASLTAVATGQPAPTIGWSRRVSTALGDRLDPICTLTTGTGGSTSATCTTAPLTLADDGLRIQAGASNGPNGVNSVSSAIATITVLPQSVAPSITTPAQPDDRTVTAGGSVTWTVGATGTAPLSYAWRTVQPSGSVIGGVICDGGYNVAPANGPTLTLSSIPLACNGHRFFVTVSNSVNPPAESRRALLTVTAAPAAPTITTPLQNRSVLNGAQVTFNVAATGTPGTFTYTWTLDGAPVPNVVSGCTPTSATCTFTAFLADSGKAVRVVVSNGTAPDAASSATLTVTTADVGATITQQPADASTLVGGTALFSIGVAGTPTPSVTWETSTDGLNWTSAGTGVTFTITGATLAQNGLRVRARVVNTIATSTGSQTVTVISDSATLTVRPTPPPGMAILAGDFTAGTGSGGVAGVGTAARFDVPESVLADAAGNLWVANSNGGTLMMIDPNAVATRVRVVPNAGYMALAPNGDLFVAMVDNCGVTRLSPPLIASGPGESLSVTGCLGTETRGVAVDSSGALYLALRDANSIVRATRANVYVWQGTLFAGAGSVSAPPGSSDGTGSAVRFNSPRGIAFGPDGSLYVADSGNHTIRRITSQGVVSTFAGSAGQAGTVDDTGAAARLYYPTDLAFDTAGNLVVLQRGDPANPQAHVRRITPAGVVSTLFDATAEALALAQPGQESAARVLRGVAVLADGRIALAAGNAILVRTLP